MNEAQRVEALLALYKQQMEHFRHTQEIEWKANFGIWTLLAGAIYIVTKEPVHISRGWAALAALIAATGLHACWLWRVHYSEISDKQLWTRYRAEALQLIRGNETLHEHETPWKRSHWHEAIWLSVEIMVTALLCVFLFQSLPC
jgi:hypothetical protein